MRLILFLIVVFVANILQALTGFAGTLLAMPPSILLIGADSARASLNVVGLVLSIYICLKNYQHINYRELGKIIALMSGGMIVGLIIYEQVDTNILLTGYGIMIVLIALKKLFLKHEFKLNPLVMQLIIFCAGIIHAIFISGGALLVVYASATFKDKAQFRATLSAIWIVLNTFLFGQHIVAGLFDPVTIKYTLLAIVPALCSVYVGNKIYERVNQQMFMKITYVLLLISGVSIFF